MILLVGPPGIPSASMMPRSLAWALEGEPVAHGNAEPILHDRALRVWPMRLEKGQPPIQSMRLVLDVQEMEKANQHRQGEDQACHSNEY